MWQLLIVFNHKKTLGKYVSWPDLQAGGNTLLNLLQLVTGKRVKANGQRTAIDITVTRPLMMVMY